MPPFTLPDDDASPAEVYTALATLNAIRMTADQFESAYSIFTGDQPGTEDWVLRYCREAGLLPAEAALEIIRIRHEYIADEYEGGFDVFGKDRARLADIVAMPVTYEDLGFSNEEMNDPLAHYLTEPPLN